MAISPRLFGGASPSDACPSRAPEPERALTASRETESLTPGEGSIPARWLPSAVEPSWVISAVSRSPRGFFLATSRNGFSKELELRRRGTSSLALSSSWGTAITPFRHLGQR